MQQKNHLRRTGLPLEGILLFALYIALPSYFAVELKAGLPLLTASRVLLALAGIGVLLRRRDVFTLQDYRWNKLNLQLTADKPLMTCLIIYFVLLLAVNAAFLTQTSEGIKQIFVILAEEYALTWIITMTLTTRKKITDALKILVLVSGVLGICACITVVLDYNIFHFLDTAHRSDLVVRHFYRYGMLRPTCGFHHAVYYGSFCAVMLPIEMYFVEQEENKAKQKLYAMCTALTLVGLLLANSRGSQLAFVAIAGLIFLIRLLRKRIAKLFKTYIPIILVALMIVAVVFVCCPAGQYRFQSTPAPPSQDSTASTDPTQSLEDSEEKDLSFGENPDGFGSRFLQLSGIVYTLRLNPILGLGPNAPANGLVAYLFTNNQWVYLKTVDVNVVAIICQYGLVGLLGFLSLYGSLGITFLRKKYRDDPLMHHLCLAFVCYMLCLLSISFLDKWFWVFVGITLSLVNVIHKEN